MSHPTYGGTGSTPSAEESNSTASAPQTAQPIGNGAAAPPAGAYSATSAPAGEAGSDGYGAGGDGYGYDKNQTDQTEKTMRDEARPTNYDLAKKFESMHDAQTESKWGVEDAAVDYRKSYQQNLLVMRDEFQTLGDRIEKFVEALQDTVRAMENDEQDAEAIQANLQTKLQAAAMPSTSNTTTGSGPYSYNAPTASLPPINTSTSQEG
mgnify:FL=1